MEHASTMQVLWLVFGHYELDLDVRFIYIQLINHLMMESSFVETETRNVNRHQIKGAHKLLKVWELSLYRPELLECKYSPDLSRKRFNLGCLALARTQVSSSRPEVCAP